jgi:phosphatidylglycerol---prolipoprotein diacylglyceryl transferase
MLPVLNIGSLAVQTPGLILLAGLWLGLWLAEKKYSGFDVQPTVVNNLVFAGIVSTVLGGRIAFIAENFPAFIKSPVSMVSLNPALFDLPAGVLIGLGVSGWYGVRRRVHFWSLLDALTPGLAVMLIAFSLANLASGDAYGEPARLPWSIFLWGEWRHPVQAYQAVGAALVLLLKVLLPLSGRRSNDPPAPAGVFFLRFAAWSAAVQLFLGAFGGNGALIGGQVRAGQVGAWFVLAACLFLLRNRNQARFRSQPVPPGEGEAGNNKDH